MLKNALLAAALLAASSGLTRAIPTHNYYTKHCSVNEYPPSAVLDAKNGEMRWNGDKVDWETMQAYLADLPRAMKEDESGNIAMTVDKDMPHSREIIAILAKEGITLHQCKVARRTGLLVRPDY